VRSGFRVRFPSPPKTDSITARKTLLLLSEKTNTDLSLDEVLEKKRSRKRCVFGQKSVNRERSAWCGLLNSNTAERLGNRRPRGIGPQHRIARTDGPPTRAHQAAVAMGHGSPHRGANTGAASRACTRATGHRASGPRRATGTPATQRAVEGPTRGPPLNGASAGPLRGPSRGRLGHGGGRLSLRASQGQWAASPGQSAQPLVGQRVP
jgi:hypothetical protein